jgi:hypothetical protein
MVLAPNFMVSDLFLEIINTYRLIPGSYGCFVHNCIIL